MAKHQQFFNEISICIARRPTMLSMLKMKGHQNATEENRLIMTLALVETIAKCRNLCWLACQWDRPSLAFWSSVRHFKFRRWLAGLDVDEKTRPFKASSVCRHVSEQCWYERTWRRRRNQRIEPSLFRGVVHVGSSRSPAERVESKMHRAISEPFQNVGLSYKGI